MATTTEASTSTQETTNNVSVLKTNNVSFLVLADTDGSAQKAKRNKDTGNGDENTTASSSGSPSPSEVKKDSLLHRIKAWSPVLVLENSGSVGTWVLASTGA